MSKNAPASNSRIALKLKALLKEWDSRGGRRRDSGVIAAEIVESAECLAASPGLRALPPAAAHGFLNATGRPGFLRHLEPAAARRWAEAAFAFIRVSGYSLNDLFSSRVREIPRKVLFQDMSTPIPSQWTYEETNRHVREIAGAFYTFTSGTADPPRVAIFSENHVDTACADLACLMYDILVTPLNSHFGLDNLREIFDRLEINIAVTDTEDRARLLLELRTRTARSFKILVTDPGAGIGGAAEFLGEYCKRLSVRKIDLVLAARKRFKLNEVATVMFTSGSTGVPKGVSFSIYQLVAKRFARAAALPDVGDDEVFLSFLPLYHTFGRYFEMLGAVYWRGTYVFAGNPSAETLLSLFPKVNPTGFISVPIRWLQLYEKCMEKIDALPSGASIGTALCSVVGRRLRWGLSAAGYLDPKVFQFFEKNGIYVCSGFGLTEGTGGITMTVPGRYEAKTHGLPLPGTTVRLDTDGELHASGHYIARYLEDKGPGDIIPYPGGPGEDYWLPTGDVFRRLPSGYYQIVDRIKDIYKNNRGQTIAPRKVENLFVGVPGITRTFLVGDGRPYNVLFIIPDRGDEVLRAALDADNERAYYRRIVSAANLDLAPYERVVNFSVLERDFEIGRGELTAKGSYVRRTIEQNFEARIEDLYRAGFVDLYRGGLRVRIPLWFYRDLGILEDEIVFEERGLRDVNRDIMLPLCPDGGAGRFLVGDLIYTVHGGIIDLGVFARQPYLWAGNPALVRFCPCKEGWDVQLDTVSEQVSLPWKRERVYAASEIPKPARIADSGLVRLNELFSRILFGDAGEENASAAAGVEEIFNESENLRISTLIRRRLEALARHPEEKIRCWAYRLLLLDVPNPSYGESLPDFLQSGLPFLNEASIGHIVSSKLGRGRFDALRRRMCAYRHDLEWPATSRIRNQFYRIFQLFVNFARVNPLHYGSVRAELASWVLHTADPVLSGAARSFLDKLAGDFQAFLAAAAPALSGAEWDDRLVFENGIEPGEAVALREILTRPHLLRESILLAYELETFDPSEIEPKGIWVSRLPVEKGRPHYRVSVNTRSGKHFDLRLAWGKEWTSAHGIETALWLIALADFPYGRRVNPHVGAWHPDTGVLTGRYSGDLTAWEKIREFAGRQEKEGAPVAPKTWRKLFIDAFAAFFRAADYSQFRIVPGLVSPANVIVPDLDFREDAIISSLVDWKPYAGPLSLVRPMVDGFYGRIAAAYPGALASLDVNWIFDACYEALGHDKTGWFLDALSDCLARDPLTVPGGADLTSALDAYLEYFRKNYIIPIPALNAINKYKEWEIGRALDVSETKEGKLAELFRAYGLDRYPEIVRFYLYRHTYFAGLGGKVCAAFDRLLDRMGENIQKSAIQLLELSDLQAVLKREEDRRVFSKMVFPKLQGSLSLDVLRFGETGKKQVVVHSRLADSRGAAFSFGETYDPAEIGQLYRLFFRENYPKVISEQDRHFVVKDVRERIVGGLCYHVLYKNVVFIDAMVVTSALKGRGLGRAMLEDFCSRMAGLKFSVVLTHFFLPAFFLKAGFKVDKRWGALVKYL